MKYFILFLSLFFIGCAEAEAESKQQTYLVRINRIVDGDTIYGTYQNYPVKIRLYGIDSPEKKQSFGTEATEKLAQLVNINEEFLVEVVDFDNFGRAVGIIHLKNGKTVQEELLKNGIVWFYPQYCKLNICNSWKELEKTAQNNELGLWSEKSPTPPWEFRRK